MHQSLNPDANRAKLNTLSLSSSSCQGFPCLQNSDLSVRSLSSE